MCERDANKYCGQRKGRSRRDPGCLLAAPARLTIKCNKDLTKRALSLMRPGRNDG